MTAPGDDSLRTLLDQLSDPNADLAGAQLEALSDIDSLAVEQFQPIWRQLPDQRRLDLIRRIGAQADDDIHYSFDRINVLALDDPAAAIRQAAIRNLWESDDAGLVPLFLRRLEGDSSIEVRTAAAGALGHFIYLGELGEITPDLLHRIEAALMPLAPVGDEIGRRSLESLGYSSRPEVAPLIEAAYRDGSMPLRRSALLAMGRSCNDGWSDQVLAHLHDPAPELRLEAVRAAGDLELREATPDIIDLLDDVDQPTRHAAIWALGQLGGREALRALSRQFDHADNDEDAGLLRDALDNLAFVDGMGDFLFTDSDEPAADDA